MRAGAERSNIFKRLLSKEKILEQTQCCFEPRINISVYIVARVRTEPQTYSIQIRCLTAELTSAADLVLPISLLTKSKAVPGQAH
jgi:hypothetical protein